MCVCVCVCVCVCRSIDKGNFLKKAKFFFYRTFFINVRSAFFRIDFYQKLFEPGKIFVLRLFQIKLNVPGFNRVRSSKFRWIKIANEVKFTNISDVYWEDYFSQKMFTNGLNMGMQLRAKSKRQSMEWKYVMHSISIQACFIQAFKIGVDYWKFAMLLLYILWDDWPIFMISDSNEQLQQQVEYTLLKPDCHSWWISNFAIWKWGHFKRMIYNKIVF